MQTKTVAVLALGIAIGALARGEMQPARAAEKPIVYEHRLLNISFSGAANDLNKASDEGWEVVLKDSPGWYLLRRPKP